MYFNTRTIVSCALLGCLVGAAEASSYATGGADNQTWILSTGADITYFAEVGGFYAPSGITGSAFAGYSNTTNNPVSGGTYYNTNSFMDIPKYGAAYEESIEGADYFFANNGQTVESVTLQYQGYVTAMASASTSTDVAVDYAQSYLLDQNDNNKLEFNCGFEADSFGITSGTNSLSGTYTFYLNPGQSDVIQSEAYNEAFGNATPEPAPFAALGLGILPLVLKRRSKKSA